MDSKMMKPLLAMLSILFAGNVFFVARLVEKLDRTENAVWELKIQVISMKSSIDVFNEKIEQRAATVKKKKKTSLASF